MAEDPKSLVFKCAEALDDKPALHAFLIGVSRYPNFKDVGGNAEQDFGLKQLTCAATSAVSFYQWLKASPPTELAAPLASVCMLLSAGQGEAQAWGEESLAAGAMEATAQNVLTQMRSWRKMIAARPQDLALFYFAGHGVALGPEQMALLASDFAGEGPLLDCALSFSSILRGMAPPAPLNQLYIIDACRQFPKELASVVSQPRSVFDFSIGVDETRNAPVFFATSEGTEAWAPKAGSRTVYLDAFLRGLDGAAGEMIVDDSGDQRWAVTDNRMRTVINDLMGAKNVQNPAGSGILKGQMVLRWLSGPPKVRLRVATKPEELGCGAQVTVSDMRGTVVHRWGPPDLPPFEAELPAGSYVVAAQSAPPDRPLAANPPERTLTPPLHPCTLKATP